MSHRDKNPERAIIEAVIRQKGSEWSKSTQDTARSDAQRILEALLAEVGVEGAVQALDHEGLAGYAHRYFLNPSTPRPNAGACPQPKARQNRSVGRRNEQEAGRIPANTARQRHAEHDSS